MDELPNLDRKRKVSGESDKASKKSKKSNVVPEVEAGAPKGIDAKRTAYLLKMKQQGGQKPVQCSFEVCGHHSQMLDPVAEQPEGAAGRVAGGVRGLVRAHA